MCGIAGQLHLDGLQAVSKVFVQRMTDAIAHRGPDGEGHYIRGPIGLGHRRLAIIDLHTGAQPMCNEDETVWIAFNGEIYNYRELREDLVARGHIFKSSSDTEVIVHLYEELGESCVTRLRGMFAFAIWDERSRKLFLARDRVGIKPLYYAISGNSLLFGSEIKALLVDPALPRRISPQAIDRFLTYYYLPGGDTLFEGIHKLEPGHYLTVAHGQLVKRQYWDFHLASAAHEVNFDGAVEELQNLLRRSVKAHMVSDVPVGILLSGGVDSTGVLRYASEQSSSPIHTFTVGFEGMGLTDERPFARLAAQRFETLHQEITITAKDFGDFLPRYVWHMEEPVCEPPAVALYYVSQLARQSSVKVLLSGEGGDEAFGGYNKYAYLLALEATKSLLGPAKGLLGLVLDWSAHFGCRSLPPYARLVPATPDQYYLSCTSSPYTPFNQGKSILYAASFAESMAMHESDQPTRHLFSKLRGEPLLNQMLYVDGKTWLPDDLLVKADKMSMAASVELRVPLLDNDVLEFAMSLPPHFKVRGWPPKRVLRAALRDSVPREILKRKKVGFPVPYERWLRHELKEYVHDTILSHDSMLSTYFRRDALVQLTDSNLRGANRSQEIFSLLVLELMHQQFVRDDVPSLETSR